MTFVAIHMEHPVVLDRVLPPINYFFVTQMPVKEQVWFNHQMTQAQSQDYWDENIEIPKISQNIKT